MNQIWFTATNKPEWKIDQHLANYKLIYKHYYFS